MLNSDSTVARPTAPITRRWSGLASSCSIACASAGASPGGTSTPFSHCVTSSGMPAICVATTGTPAAIASISTTGTPSAKLGSTKTSLCDSASATSDWPW